MHRRGDVRHYYLTIILMVSLLTLSLWMGIPGVEGAEGSFGGGDGSAGNPYIIEDVWDLQNMSSNLSAHYILDNDIDASSTSSWNSGAGFEPVGTRSFAFTGSLDGKNHTIMGLSINHPWNSYVGLFGYLGKGSSVRNVGLIDCDVNGSACVGGLMGYSWGTVSNCYAMGNVNGIERIGGLVGYISRGLVSNCYATGNASGDRFVGELVGQNFGTVQNCHAWGNVSGGESVGGLVGFHTGDRVSNCYAMGNVTGSSEKAGGLIGWSTETVANCSAMANVKGSSYVGGLLGHNNENGTISDCYATGNVSGTRLVGGLVGYNSVGTVSNCYATGNVNGDDRIGGLVGYQWEDCTMSNCYSTGNVSGVEDVGGLLGYNVGTVSNCYSTGNVSGNDDVGGLVGTNNQGTVSNSFWDMETSGLKSGAGGTGMNTSQMKTRSIFINAGWDFIKVWCMKENVTYPLLSWQDDGYPVANAGPDFNIDGGTLATLDGSSSTDYFGIINYTWTFNDGANVALYGAQPVYRFNNLGEFLVTLNVTDAPGHWDTDTMNVTVLDLTPPTADAGPDQLIDVGTVVTFNGSGSWDNVGVVNFTWTLVDGATVTLYGVRTTHRFDRPGTFEVTLNVTDVAGLMATDTMTLTVRDTEPPVAVPPEDIETNMSEEVTFDGTTSTDNVGIVEYRWAFEDQGEEVVLFGAERGYPFLEAGVYLVTLEVTDGAGNVGNASFNVNVRDTEPPWAMAGDYDFTGQHIPIVLNASASSDNVGIIEYLWTFDHAGEEVRLEGAVVEFTFTEAGEFAVFLTVTDAAGNSDIDRIDISVYDNTPPVADAGEYLEVDQGEEVVLDGSASSDNNGIWEWEWEFHYQGENHSLEGETVTFVFEVPATVVITLTVRDNHLKDSDMKVVMVRDTERPRAKAGENITINVGAVAYLNGGNSTDNVRVMKWTWSFTYRGYHETLDGHTVPFTFEDPGTYEVTLTVEDPAGLTDTDVLVVNVRSREVEESNSIMIILLLAMVAAVAIALFWMKKNRM